MSACHFVLNLRVHFQVMSRSWIKANKYETSFSCLARRAQKTNNFWNRTVRKGSSLRRVSMFGELHYLWSNYRLDISTVFPWTLVMPYVKAYTWQVFIHSRNCTTQFDSTTVTLWIAGLFQAIYTIIVLMCFAPVSTSFWASFCWQVVKITSAVFYGSREICEKAPRRAIIKVWSHGQWQEMSPGGVIYVQISVPGVMQLCLLFRFWTCGIDLTNKQREWLCGILE